MEMEEARRRLHGCDCLGKRKRGSEATRRRHSSDGFARIAAESELRNPRAIYMYVCIRGGGEDELGKSW